MDILRFTAAQADDLARHLLPADQREAVAVGLCGRVDAGERRIWTLHRVVGVPHANCRRTPQAVEWPTRQLYDLLSEAGRRGLAVVKFHSHPHGPERFSTCDDRSDREVMAACGRRLASPQLSVLLTGEGRYAARVVAPDARLTPAARIAIVGDDIRIHDAAPASASRAFDQRHRQLFGDRTTDILGRLRIGVVGVSGTGSPLIEMLARLGVGHLVLVDDDVVETKNLNRIFGATARDAAAARPKAEVLARHVRRMGLGAKVEGFVARVEDPAAARALAACDVIFGCMDSVEGRDSLNRLATRTCLPYFDLGVRLDADGCGGVNSVSSVVHYLQPGRSSLRSRNVYSDQELYAEHLYRTDRQFYADQVQRGYIRGVTVDRPAVVSVNTATAALAVNELLARLHPYRTRPNAEFAAQRILFSHGRMTQLPEAEPDESLAADLGLGLGDPQLEGAA